VIVNQAGVRRSVHFPKYVPLNELAPFVPALRVETQECVDSLRRRILAAAKEAEHRRRCALGTLEDTARWLGPREGVGRQSTRTITIEPSIYQVVRTSDNRPTGFRVVVSVPDLDTNRASTRSGRFGLDTPIEKLRSVRDTWKLQAERAWAPILAERKERARERRLRPRVCVRIARNICKGRTGCSVEWSAPTSSGIRARHRQWFEGEPPLASLARFRDAREREAKGAWAQIRE
jgi:hypothetical protein